MDPYIEACGLWEGFHSHLIEAIYRTLARMLPRGYTADTNVRNYVVVMERDGKEEYLAKPDESVPMRAFIEIYAEAEGQALVTCIEVLSPSNKRRGTKGWTKYHRKRQAMLLGKANFIEIDLLRDELPMPMLDSWPDAPYRLLVSRRLHAPHCRAWPAHFRKRLPVLPVPLASPDPDLSLDLQPLIDEIYSLGRYHERIDYSRPLTPPLSEPDAAWVQEQVQSRKGTR
jgi:hypothetical protein